MTIQGNPVFCPVCQQKGLKSKVFVGGARITAMCAEAFYDEEGIYHCHDPNIMTRDYRCSNGHVWQVKGHGNCPCGWNNGGDETTILNDKETNKGGL
jgi:hypothetical protein